MVAGKSVGVVLWQLTSAEMDWTYWGPSDPFVQYYWQLNQQFSLCVNLMKSVLNTNWKYLLPSNNDDVCKKLQYRSKIVMGAQKPPILYHFFFLSNVVISSQTECLTGTDPIGGLETAFFSNTAQSDLSVLGVLVSVFFVFLNDFIFILYTEYPMP
jgi:hypothetical protein